MPRRVNQNIETIAQITEQLDRRIGRHQRVVDAVTRSVGRPRTVYVLLVGVVAWVVLNLFAPRVGLPALDHPPFDWLQGVLTLYAALVATSVLATQNRLTREAEQRAHLELQVNLLAEQKTTKIIALIEELRRDLPIVKDREDPVAQALLEEVDPHAVLQALEGTMEGAPPEGEPPPAPPHR